MKTRSAICYAVGEPLRVAEVELDEPRAGEVLVRMVAAGVCHSDLNYLSGDQPAPLPMILGHEGAGIVERVGPGVEGVGAGDRVVLTFAPSCGRCRYCLRGLTHLCELGRRLMAGCQLDGSYRFHDSAGRNLGQLFLVSAWSEHTVVPAASAVKITDGIAPSRACLVSCAVATGVGAVLNKARVTAGSTVLVIGCGGVGVNVVQGARVAAAEQIIAADINAEKLAAARHFGATETVDMSAENVVERVKALTDRAGVDYSFVVVGGDAVIGQAVAATAKGGVCTIVALSPAAITSIPVNPTALVLLEKTVQGSFYGSCQVQRDIPRFLAMAEAGQLDLDALVTRTYSLDAINEAVADLVTGKNIRGVIEFSSQ